MWFGDNMTQVYNEAIAPAIEAAGYTPVRIDKTEHNQKIDDEIIAQIRRSKFVVADFTKHRGGVYYEAGFAQGLGLQVIWTCREDDINDLHFDTRQYNHILWNNQELPKFKDALHFRIESILGRGTADLRR